MFFRKYIYGLFLSSVLFGQVQSNINIAGPSVGFSFLGSAIQLGLNHEYVLGTDGKDNNGIGQFGVGGILRYWTYSETFPAVEWSYFNLLVGLQANYHFNLSNNVLDPWAGLLVGYNIGSLKSKILNQNIEFEKVKNGGILYGANAGLRYWIDKKTAFSFRIGIGTQNYGALDLAIDFIL